MKKSKLIERAKTKIRETLKNRGRRTRCERSLSLKLVGKHTPPGDRGACEQTSLSQGSE
jgi:hypothetical protein